MSKDVLGLSKAFEKVQQQRKDDIVETLHFIGLQCLEKLKLRKGVERLGVKAYEDDTGALRDSSGYVVVYEGKAEQMGGLSGQGKAYAKQVVSENPNVTGLILVAGMEYASYVLNAGSNNYPKNENKASYDVLVSASILAEELLKKHGLL